MGILRRPPRKAAVFSIRDFARVNARILVSGNGFSTRRRLDRQTLAAMLGAVALVCAAALVAMPKGFAVFGSLLLLATLLMPRTFAREWAGAGPILRSAALLALLALGLSILSMQFTGQGWRTVDHHARLLLVPWCGMLALAIAPSRFWLWLGAMTGVCLAFGMALAEAMSGVERVGAGSNPIVFANTILALLVLAVYCRPVGRKPQVLLAVAATLALGTAAIVMSGSRGVLPGLGLVILGGDDRQRRQAGCGCAWVCRPACWPFCSRCCGRCPG